MRLLFCLYFSLHCAVCHLLSVFLQEMFTGNVFELRIKFLTLPAVFYAYWRAHLQMFGVENAKEKKRCIRIDFHNGPFCGVRWCGSGG